MATARNIFESLQLETWTSRHDMLRKWIIRNFILNILSLILLFFKDFEIIREPTKVSGLYRVFKN
jgi:hypothetical protein